MVGACVKNKKNSELEGSCLLAPSCEYKGEFSNIALELVGPPWFLPGFLEALVCGGCRQLPHGGCLCEEEL